MVRPHQDNTLFPQMLSIAYVTLFESEVADFQVHKSSRDCQAVPFPKHFLGKLLFKIFGNMRSHQDAYTNLFYSYLLWAISVSDFWHCKAGNTYKLDWLQEVHFRMTAICGTMMSFIQILCKRNLATYLPLLAGLMCAFYTVCVLVNVTQTKGGEIDVSTV